MRFGVKILSSVVLLGGLVGVYFGDEYFSTKKEHQKKESAVALSFDSNDCTKFSIENENGNFLFERKSLNDPWYFSEPLRTRTSPPGTDVVNRFADQDEVNSLLVSLRNIYVQRELINNKNNYDNNNDNGLASSTLKFQITCREKTLEVTKNLTFGKNVDDNQQTSFHLPSAYAQVTGRSNILIVDNSALSTFREKEYANFRTKNIAFFNTSDVTEIVVQKLEVDPVVKPRSSSVIPRLDRGIHIALKNNVWMTTSPVEALGDKNFIAQFFDIYQTFTAEKIIEAPTNETLKLNGVDIMKPTARVTFKKNDQSLNELSFYMTRTGVFVSMADGGFAQVDIDKWSELIPQFKNFRDKSIFSAGVTKCDFKLENLIADDIIDYIDSKDLENFGFQNPIQTFNCENSLENPENTKKIRIFVGNRVPMDEKNVYVKRSDPNIIYIVRHESLSTLAQPNHL